MGDSRLCFVSRSVLMSSPELTRVCRHVLSLASSGPCGLHLALDWPSLSLTQFCRASASAKPLVTYTLFQQVSCDISAEKPCRKSINVFFIVESHQWRTASHSLSISFHYFLSSLVLLNTLACRAGSAELRSHWLTWVTGMTERTRPCGSCCCHCPPLIDSELLSW